MGRFSNGALKVPLQEIERGTLSNSTIGIGLLGLGVVGSGVASVLTQKKDRLSELIGSRIELMGILVRDQSKPRSDQIPVGLITHNADDILNDTRINIVIELIGGQDPAHKYIRESIDQGRHVVTANKEVMAHHGPDILSAAQNNNVQVMFEAAVAGGTPIIAPLMRDLVANEIISIRGIVNGTTNYILSRMSKEGADFNDALAEAQKLGYAEANPTNDVEGIDAAYKLAILATLSFHVNVRHSDVFYEGITRLTSKDFQYADELGYAIKLLAIANLTDLGVQTRVHPTLVPKDMMIAKVDGVLNAIEVQTNLAGNLLFHGAGAGSAPTTSAVIADVVDVARNFARNVVPSPVRKLGDGKYIRPMSELETRYYIRLTTADQPKVLAQVGTVLGDLNISIASAIQKEINEQAQEAEIVLMTHKAPEASMQRAIKRLNALEAVGEIGSLIRVEEN